MDCVEEEAWRQTWTVLKRRRIRGGVGRCMYEEDCVKEKA